MTALIAAGLATAIGSSARGQDSTNQVAYSIQLQATIDPATEKWVSSALDDAAAQDAAVVIIRLDTPGGLVDSLRSIVQDMAAAPMPVIVYVSPNGARAASAGAYITEAADVAAMAPETNIGSATPIAIDAGGGTSDLDRKIVNDAAASMRALAADHGRNAKLADELVTKATNLTADEALRAGLIDVIAPSQEALLKKLDGFRVQGPKAQTLHTAELQVEDHDMPLQYDLLEIIVNPTVSYLLILVGIVGLGIELFAPGAIAPGAIGLVSFLLGLYGTAQLPVTAVGVLLLVAGVALIIAEAHLSAHGILGAAGVVALVASGLLLYDTNTSAFEVSAPVVIAAGLLIGGFLAFAVDRAVRARRRPVRTGWEEMVGAAAVVREPLDPVGMVYVEGALWRAKLEDGADGRALDRGARVRVEAVDGLTLKVKPVEAEPEREEGAS
jgi:membrane-bound serine protease (ClpP class)